MDNSKLLAILGLGLATTTSVTARAGPDPVVLDQTRPRAEVDLDGDGDKEIIELFSDDHWLDSLQPWIAPEDVVRPGQPPGSIPILVHVKPSDDAPGQLLFAWDDCESWAHGLTIEDRDGDGRLDLEFWTGSDIGNNVIWLLGEGSHFRAIQLGFIRDVYDYTALFPFPDRPPSQQALDALPEPSMAPVARWDAQRRTFVGISVGWIDGEQVTLFTEPSHDAEPRMSLSTGSLVTLVDPHSPQTLDGPQNLWVQVRWDEGVVGWLPAAHLSDIAPTEIWPRPTSPEATALLDQLAASKTTLEQIRKAAATGDAAAQEALGLPRFEMRSPGP